ncbi:MAG: peptide chain release factor N(5)-glutamine methyltransferase [Lachnospiraceae bacterium]|nr:peptide chain release factor N(5)-glutamine methyltransferase [Lachnospiraceae bacterium]
MSKIDKERVYSHLGGQAVLEGVMMRNARTGRSAVAVRLEDGSITVNSYAAEPEDKKSNLARIPVIRGVLAFIDSIVMGMKAMNIAVDLYAGEGEAPGGDMVPGEGELSADTAEAAPEEDAGSVSGAEESGTGLEGSGAEESGTAPEGSGAEESGTAPEGSGVEDSVASDVKPAEEEELPEGLEILEEFEPRPAEPQPEEKGKSPAGRKERGKRKASLGRKEGDPKAEKARKERDPEAEKARKEAGEQAMSAIVTVLALGIGVFLFIILPFLIVSFLKEYILNESMLAIIEGVLRVVIFVVYILAISMVEDIRRTFGYHGAEHKCINCLETGKELTVENVRACPKAHRRCGTSFLILVMLVSVVVFFFIRVEDYVLRIVLRLLLIPVIAGISYEIIKLSSRSENIFTAVLSAPGLLLQKLTVREPDDEMIRAGIASVEAVIDWREFLQENFGDRKQASLSESVDMEEAKDTESLITYDINNNGSYPEYDGTEENDDLSGTVHETESEVPAAYGIREEETPEENGGILREAEEILRKAGVPDPENDAFILFKFITGMSREDLLDSGDSGVSERNRKLLREMIGRRATREPLQLITEEAPFMGFDFIVRSGVLIPRFDTEILVEEAMKNTGSGARILDLCTGTGCILTSLLRYSNDTTGVGVDISEEAIALAKENSDDLISEERVVWVTGDLFDALGEETGEDLFEMITANPPYIRSSEIPGLMPEVRDYEPEAALDGGEDGLDMYRRIIPGALDHLKPGGMIFLEIGYDQAEQVKQLLEENGYIDVSVTKDYSGNDRVICARKKAL